MLQGKGNDSRCFILICFLGALTLGSCRPDTSGNTSEREAYFADYEKQEHHWGFIDTLGQIIIAPIYDEVSQFSEGKAAVNLEGLWGYIDRSGHNLTKAQYKSAFAFHDRRARVQDFEQHEFFISPEDRQIISADWKAADDFSEGIAKVRIGSS
ncbi:MAG TPA: WG repeat-containing protein, partial [Saprospiraceae bacterium]|nr:WG repeat-containing protein [Saprospiraceae bacterium]